MNRVRPRDANAGSARIPVSSPASQSMKANSKSALNEQFYLRQVELFQDLSPAELKALEKMMPVKKVAAGTVFYTPQQAGAVLFLLKEGRVRLYHLSAEGRDFTTATVEAGTFFGEMALLGQGLYSSYAEAVTPCLLCIMSHQDVRMLLQHDPRIAYRVIEMMGRRLSETEQRLADFALKRVAARLATQLLQLARSQLVREQRADVPVVGSVEVTCTHEELARNVGAYRETITKILNEWRGQGWVELYRGRIVLLEMKSLRHLSVS